MLLYLGRPTCLFFFSFFFLHARSYIYMQYVFLRVCGWHELTKLVSQEEKNYTLHTLTENIFMRCLCVFIGTCFFLCVLGEQLLLCMEQFWARILVLLLHRIFIPCEGYPRGLCSAGFFSFSPPLFLSCEK